jgi:hypothetical protein
MDNHSTHATLVTPSDTFKIEYLNIRNNLNHIQKYINIHIIHIIQKRACCPNFLQTIVFINSIIKPHKLKAILATLRGNPYFIIVVPF